MVMIYKILSEDLIEKNASQAGDFDSALLSLGKAIAKVTDLDAQFTKFHINDLIKKDYIRFNAENGTIHFFWAHNNKTDLFH